MSEPQFGFPPVPLMTPERAREVVRSYKALADHFTEIGMPSEAGRLERQSQRWMTCSIALAVKPGDTGETE